MTRWLAALLACCFYPGVPGAPAENNSKFREPGSIVVFGRYEQDNDPENGKEPVEWTVLDVQEGKSLLLSRCGLDARQYHQAWVRITWEKSNLRRWLNDDFFRMAFSDEEKKAILWTDVSNFSEAGWGGKDTEDRVFLLSDLEAGKYLQTREDRLCICTPYAAARGASTFPGDACWWWLRSAGNDRDEALYYHPNDRMYSRSVIFPDGCIRPAVWVDTDAEIFR